MTARPSFRVRLPALALAILGIAGCRSSEPPIELTLEPYEFDAPDGTSVVAELGRFSVPENRARPDGRQISLAFVRLPSRAENPGNPIVYLAGGPGGSGISTMYGPRWALFDALRDVADVIAFDQRGTGESNDVPICEVPAGDRPALEEPLTLERATEWYRGQARRCEAWWTEEGYDISAYNTVESAADLDGLRRALNAERLDLWSISYGSHLAMAAMKTMGDRLGRVVMAGSEGPDDTVKFPAENEAFLEHLSDIVAQESAGRYPDLLGTIHEVLDRVEADPPIVELATPDGGTVEVGLSRFTLQLLTGFLTKNPEDQRALPGVFYSMAGGDFGFAARAVYQLQREYLSGLQAMPLAMDYASGISEERARLVREQAETAAMGDALNFPMPHLVGALRMKDLGDDFRRPVRTDVPTLFLSGTLDGRTYLPAHEALKRGFTNATRIIIENAGHDMFMSHPDLIPLIRDFFAGASVGDRRLHLDPPRFF